MDHMLMLWGSVVVVWVCAAHERDAVDIEVLFARF